MVDTIRLKFDHSMVNYKMDFMAEVSARIDVDIKKSNEFKIEGHLKNMRIYIEPTYVLIEGSLPKYFYDSNLITLSLSDINNAIDKLSIDLGLPLHEAIVTRVDMGVNLEMENPPKSYFIYFDELNHYERTTRGRTSLYYEQPKRFVLIFYDKIAEAKKHKDPTLTPELLKKNILRYEIRCWRPKLKYLFKYDIKAKDLYDLDIIQKFMELCVYTYIKIVKKSLLNSKLEMTKQGLFKHLLMITNKRINVMKFIESHSVKGDRRANNLKNNVIKILNEKENEDGPVEEFTDKLGYSILEYHCREYGHHRESTKAK